MWFVTWCAQGLMGAVVFGSHVCRLRCVLRSVIQKSSSVLLMVLTWHPYSNSFSSCTVTFMSLFHTYQLPHRYYSFFTIATSMTELPTSPLEFSLLLFFNRKCKYNSYLTMICWSNSFTYFIIVHCFTKATQSYFYNEHCLYTKENQSVVCYSSEKLHR